MAFVTLVNRSSKTLFGTWDGKEYRIAPGKHEFEEVKARKFKEQNPIMGTEDPYTMEKRYLIGIVEDNDPIDPIEQSNAISLMDLADKIKSGEYQIVKGNGLYAPSGVDAVAKPFEPKGILETSFTKP